MIRRGLLLILPLLAFSLIVTDASAQSYYQTSRSFVRSPYSIGMGDAGVAFASRHNVFFHNPAHLTQAVGFVPRVNLLGLQGTISTTVIDQIRFYRNDLDPALSRGINNLEPEERMQLYEQALAVGRRRAFLNGDVILPSIMVRTGPVGIGAGAFVHGQAMYHFVESEETDDFTGQPIPQLGLDGRVDAMLVGSGAVDFSYFGAPGLSAGLTAKFTRRYLTHVEESLEGMNRRQPVLVFTGNALGFDLGILYEVPLPLPGTLNAGAAAYDIVTTDFAYEFDRELGDNDPDQNYINEVQATVQERFGLSPSYRVGAAYTIPSLGGIFGESGVAVDYVGYQKPNFEQPFASHLRVGAQAQLAGLLRARAGFSQGYMTLGAGIGLGVVQLDYAFFAVEERGEPAQLAGWNHLLQIRLGL